MSESKGNDYRKEYRMDEFARHFYCDHARLNQLRNDKRASKRVTRRNRKRAAERERKDYDSG